MTFNDMEGSDFIYCSSVLGAIRIPWQEVESGVKYDSPSLQGFTDEQLIEFEEDTGCGFFDEVPYNRVDGLKFLAQSVNNEIEECCEAEILAAIRERSRAGLKSSRADALK
ncbi:MAG: hypothetical protein NC311_11495 [Muribaculaceae bacterium]|nr:hypothetical protein [Muribaculaceae bacterium]